MEACEKHANVCSSLNLAPATVSTIMATAEKTSGTENYKTAHIKHKLHYKFYHRKKGTIMNTMG
jgi:hypothetical protein